MPAVPNRRRTGIREDLAKVWRSARRRWRELVRQVVGAAVARAGEEETKVLSALEAKQA